jgi:hypothetical protein
MSSEITIKDKSNLAAVTNVTKNILQNFKEQVLISKDDLDSLNEAKEFAISSFVDTPQYRPMIVKLSSVLSDGQFPTTDAKFWQCKAEAEVHFNELVRNVYKIESLKVDIEELGYKIKTAESILNSDSQTSKEIGDPEVMKFDIRRLKIKKESIEFEVKLIEKNTKYRIEEVTDWYNIASSLVKNCKYDIHDKNKSITESLFKKLEYEISRATDENAKKNLEDQLNTLKKTIFKKVVSNSEEKS